MSQILEIPASAYTPEIETLGALPDIPTFDCEPVPVSRNPLTPGTRPLQLLPSPGTEFPVRYETSRMRDFQSEVNLGKARSGGSATDASAFLAGPAYASSGRRCRLRGLLCRNTLHTAPFPARYAICIDGAVERLHAHLRVRVRRDDPHAPSSLSFSTAQPADTISFSVAGMVIRVPYLPRGGEDPEYWRSFLNDWELSDVTIPDPWDCEAWSTYSGREVAELHTRSRLLMRGYWVDRYFLGERVYDTPVAPAQWRRAEAAAEAGAAAAPAGLAGVVLGDVSFPPDMDVVLDPGLGLGSGIFIPADLRQAPPPVQLDPEHTTHCRPRGTRRFASDSGLPDPTSVGSTLMYMSGTWKSVGCEGISLVSLVGGGRAASDEAGG
ncbi:hypothetical protein JCGZ_19736 [Jatropha curcas]|uniref:Aminotransferase-like plant mobile domain-containing protein n=1 Tax=Jatropha curcas TaxID=180498 RepID=A0A067JVY0_JATCU|nr:hypothetical protein JCGZ_19736 [Jatropha curcas]